MTAKELQLLIKDYFLWLDVEKKYPSAGFAKVRKMTEQKLRKIIKEKTNGKNKI